MRPCLQLRDVLMLFGLLPLVLSCGSSPAAPCLDQNGRGDTRFNEIKLSCVTTASQLQCQAVADIAGLYVYCPMSEDVTQAADWTVGDGSVVRTLMPGVFAAVAAGHTFVHATWHGLDSNMPPGTYHLRISKDGYASQDRTVTVSTGSPSADFQLLPM